MLKSARRYRKNSDQRLNGTQSLSLILKRGIKRAGLNQVFSKLLYDWLRGHRLIFSTNQMRLADTWFLALDKF